VQKPFPGAEALAYIPYDLGCYSMKKPPAGGSAAMQTVVYY
jgi:hypothetical protein